MKEVFGRVSSEEYFDSIWCDIKDAAEEIADNPVYIILNLCRVLAYKRNGYVFSKQEGSCILRNHLLVFFCGSTMQKLVT